MRSRILGAFVALSMFAPVRVMVPERSLAEAKAIMEGLGYTADKPLTLQIRYNTNDNHQRLAVAISSIQPSFAVRSSR